jgi:hypothetical protein
MTYDNVLKSRGGSSPSLPDSTLQLYPGNLGGCQVFSRAALRPDLRLIISIAASIHAAPPRVRNVSWVPPMTTANNPAKTGSIVITTAARVADTSD